MDDADYELICPLWIDTDAYSDRDRAMFVAGVEFSRVVDRLSRCQPEFRLLIHRENESRVRLASGHFKRRCLVEYLTTDDDPDGLWAYAHIL